jgi:transposase
MELRKREGSLQLSWGERRTLQKLVRHSKGRSSLHIMAVLLSDAGLTASEIGQALGLAIRTVHRLRTAWRRSGTAGLLLRPQPGRPPLVTAEYLELLLSIVERDPREQGYAFTRWTAPRLAQFLYERTGIRVTPAWIAELLRTHGYVWRKSKLTLRNLGNEGKKKMRASASSACKAAFGVTRADSSSGTGTVFALTCSRSPGRCGVAVASGCSLPPPERT